MERNELKPCPFCGGEAVLEPYESRKGYEAYVLFVIQMKGIHTFTPNDSTHKAFGDALREAADAGVKILAYDCRVKPEEMCIDARIPVVL
mgnify:CR=1 FL=1